MPDVGGNLGGGILGFFTAVPPGILGGMLFDTTGRPGPLPLLLECCLLGSANVLLLPESIFLESTTGVRLCLSIETDLSFATLGWILPTEGGIGFLSSRLLNTLRPVLYDTSLLLSGKGVVRASSISPKNLYKFSSMIV